MPEPMFDLGEFQVGGLSQDEEDELVDRVSREMVAGLADEPSPVQGLRIGDSHPSAPSLSTPSRTPPRTVDSPAFAGALSRSRPEPIGLADEIPTPDIRMSAEESARAFAPAQSALSAPEVESDGLGLASDIESARSLATPPRRAMPDARPLTSQGIVGLAETPDAASPFTDAEEAEIERGRRQDRRRKIGRAIAGILGLGVGVAGAAAGNFGVAELGNLAGSVGGAAPTNREATARRDAMRGKAMRDQAQDRALELAARQQQAAALAQGQQRQEAELALRQQQAESNMALDTARRDAILADQANAAFEREALAGNANGAREAIRARVSAIQHVPTRMAWEQRLNAEDSALDQVTDLDTLRAILSEVADTDIRRGSQGAGGSGGSGGRIRLDESGQTIAGPRPSRSAIAPPAVMPPAAVPQPPAAGFDEGLGFPPTSAPAPAAARPAERPRPGAAGPPTALGCRDGGSHPGARGGVADSAALP